jgi:hypothetical protein
VGALDLAAGEVLFNIKVEADEPEDDGDGLGAGAGMLDRVCVNYVLVDELRITQLESIEGQLVIEVLVRVFGFGAIDGHNMSFTRLPERAHPGFCASRRRMCVPFSG